MSIKLTTLKPETIAEISAATGSEQLIDKATRRNFVGLYDDERNWYIPLRARLGKTKPKDAYYATPFATTSPHFRNPGLDFQKALYVEAEGIIEIRNTLPKEQSEFITEHEPQIKKKFEEYVLSVEKLPTRSAHYLMSTVPLFPEGIEKIKELSKFEALATSASRDSLSSSIDEAPKLDLMKQLELRSNNFTAQTVVDNAHQISDYLKGLGAKNPYSIASVQAALTYASDTLNVEYTSLEQAYLTQNAVSSDELMKLVSDEKELSSKNKLELVEIIYSQGHFPVLGTDSVPGVMWQAAYQLSLEKSGIDIKDTNQDYYYQYAPHRVIDRMEDKGLEHLEAIEHYQEWLEENNFPFADYMTYSSSRFQEETQQEIQKQKAEKSVQESLFENLAAVTPEKDIGVEQTQENVQIDLQAVEFSEGYKDNEKVPQSQDLTLVLEDSESLEWADDSRLFVRAELQDTETEEPVIYTPFVVDNPRETGFISWWEDNYEAIDKQIRSSDKVVALEKELDFRRLPKLEQEKILDEQTGVLSLFDDKNNSTEVEQTVAEENTQTDKTESESYRLTQARQKLERLENEFSAAVQDVFDHQKLTNGQPMNDKRTGGAFFKKQNQKEDKAGELQAEIKKQRERIEALEWREENAKLGLNASGGLVKSVENIELWQQRVERLEFVRDYNKSHGLPIGTPFDNGTRLEYYDSKKLKDAKETLKNLSEIKEKSNQASKAITPEAQALLDSGAVSQWKKQPTYYFVKGLRKVALELEAETGNFKVSSNLKYAPKTESDQAKVQELLETAAAKNIQDKSPDVSATQTFKNSVGHYEWDFKQIAQEIFEKRASWEEFINPTSQAAITKIERYDVNAAYQSFIKDVWRSRYDYVLADEKEKLEDFTTQFKQYFYQDKSAYNETATNYFMANFTQHIASLEVLKRPKVDLEVVELIKGKSIDKLSKHMQEGLKNYRNSDQYKNYLNFVSKFHRYSENNIRLILSQNPNATRIAGAGSWKKDHGRYPSKGEKAIYIWSAPQEYILKDKAGNPKLDDNGKVQKRTFYRLLPVFDVAQTSGRELPQLVTELQSSVHNYENLFLAITNSIQTPVRFEEIENGASGYFDPDFDEIVLKSGMSESATIKTLIHEATHSELHTNSGARFGDETYRRQEFEAESVAYVVSQHYGIDSSDYSFGYLASWGMDKKDLAELKSVMAAVQKESHQLIEKIDKALEKQMTKVAQVNPLQNEIEQVKSKQAAATTVEKEPDISPNFTQGF
ncbi:hypothetical protein RyT2_17360 [Pseudolactococcus yaeyamensis]